MFHLGWFVGKGYSVHGWNQPYSGTIGTDWINRTGRTYGDQRKCQQ